VLKIVVRYNFIILQQCRCIVDCVLLTGKMRSEFNQW